MNINLRISNNLLKSPKTIALFAVTVLLFGWIIYFISLAIKNSQTGSYYGVGVNSYFEIESDSINKKIDTPAALNMGEKLSKEKIVDIAGGGGYTLFLTQKGELWGIGNNSYGQINPKSDAQSFSSAVKIDLGLDSDETIETLDSAFHHNLAITSKNRVVAWGTNNTGQLGSSSGTDRISVIPLDSSKKYKYVAAGWRHSAVLTEDGTIIAWGGVCTIDQAAQQLQLKTASLGGYFDPSGEDEAGINDCNATIGASFVQSVDPIVIHEGDIKFKKIDLGYGHIVALTDNGDVYTSGCNLFGQLGRGNREITESNLTFTKAELLSGNVKDIAAGYRNTFILNSEGQVSYVGIDFSIVNRYLTSSTDSHYSLDTARKIESKLNPAEIFKNSKGIEANQDVVLSLNKTNNKLDFTGRANWLFNSNDLRTIDFPNNIKKAIITPNKIISI
jgi:alpha-tubulin suppressor-like RCC1 family protein